MIAKINNRALIKYQQVFWYLALVYFLIVSILIIVGHPISEKLSFWGVYLVLILTVGKLIVIAEQFRRNGQTKFVLLSYLLMLVIAGTVYLGTFFI